MSNPRLEKMKRIVAGEESPPEPVELGGPPPNQPAENWLTALRKRKTAAADKVAERLQGARVLTIGHSNHGWETFLGMVKGQKVTDLVDVRSQPSSRFAPWSRSAELEELLVGELVDYHFLGGQLGGRPGDPKLYDGKGKPVYDRFREREAYQKGLARLLWLIAERDVVCIMCAEENPETCHRKLLIAPDLAAYGVTISHIRRGRCPKSSSHASKNNTP